MNSHSNIIGGIILCQKHLCVIGTIGLNFLVVLVDVTADVLSGKGITFADGGADWISWGPFIYYVSTFFYQPQHFHEFFEHFSSSLCAKNFKLQHENFVKM